MEKGNHLPTGTQPLSMEKGRHLPPQHNIQLLKIGQVGRAVKQVCPPEPDGSHPLSKQWPPSEAPEEEAEVVKYSAHSDRYTDFCNGDHDWPLNTADSHSIVPG